MWLCSATLVFIVRQLFLSIKLHVTGSFKTDTTDFTKWYHGSLKRQKPLSHFTHSYVLNTWRNVIKIICTFAQFWGNMAKRVSNFFSPNTFDKSEVPLEKSAKQLQSVKSKPGYIQLLKDLDDSKYDNSKVQ